MLLTVSFTFRLWKWYKCDKLNHINNFEKKKSNKLQIKKIKKNHKQNEWVKTETKRDKFHHIIKPISHDKYWWSKLLTFEEWIQKSDYYCAIRSATKKELWRIYLEFISIFVRFERVRRRKIWFKKNEQILCYLLLLVFGYSKLFYSDSMRLLFSQRVSHLFVTKALFLMYLFA